VLGFLGPNGAGKTTTMRMIAGFLAPSTGTAIVCGADVGTDPVAVKRRLGYLPEGAPLYVDMTTAGFLEFVASIRGLAGADRRRRLGDVVERMHLGAFCASVSRRSPRAIGGAWRWPRPSCTIPTC